MVRASITLRSSPGGGGGLPVIEREDALLPGNDGCGVAKGRKSSSLRHISAANHRATGRLMSPRPRWADRLGLPNGAGKQLKGKIHEPLGAAVTAGVSWTQCVA